MMIAFADPALAEELCDRVRAGAQRLIKPAVPAEREAFPAAHDDTDAGGRRQAVRNGYQPRRDVLTGVGPLLVKLSNTRDRAGTGRCFRSPIRVGWGFTRTYNPQRRA